ncbi:molecular chaperone [Salmonella enterica subsp. enterica]|nr:molecular chaperone [Salmonella enterica subsp. enterica serovar Abaetetuba]
MKILSFIFLLLTSIYPCVAFSDMKGQSTFGIVEPKVIMDKDRSAYNIKNTDKKRAWLVQSWIEEYSEEKTNKILSTPEIFRVNPDSSYRINLTKKGTLPDDRESVFWVVAHSVPEHGDNLPENRINIAYRFKSLLIYRPNSIKMMKFNPEELSWKETDGGVELSNNTPFAITITKLNIDGVDIKLDDDLIMPFSQKKTNHKAYSGAKVVFSFKNDHGAINVANAQIKKY